MPAKFALQYANSNELDRAIVKPYRRLQGAGRLPWRRLQSRCRTSNTKIATIFGSHAGLGRAPIGGAEWPCEVEQWLIFAAETARISERDRCFFGRNAAGLKDFCGADEIDR